MRLFREILSVFLILIVVFLVLTQYTGFTKDVAALGESTAKLAATFQGRAA